MLGNQDDLFHIPLDDRKDALTDAQRRRRIGVDAAGYRLPGRCLEEGPGGLAGARSPAPHRHGMAMAEETAAAIVALRASPWCGLPGKALASVTPSDGC